MFVLEIVYSILEDSYCFNIVAVEHESIFQCFQSNLCVIISL